MFISMPKKSEKITPETVKKIKKEVKPQKKAKLDIASPVGSVEVDKVAKKSISNIEKRLNAQERFHIMIPLGIGEKKGASHEVCINGWVKSYPKGVMLEVPRTVFELLSECFKITSEVGKEWEVNRDSRTQAALS